MFDWLQQLLGGGPQQQQAVAGAGMGGGGGAGMGSIAQRFGTGDTAANYAPAAPAGGGGGPFQFNVSGGGGGAGGSDWLSQMFGGAGGNGTGMANGQIVGMSANGGGAGGGGAMAGIIQAIQKAQQQANAANTGRLNELMGMSKDQMGMVQDTMGVQSKLAAEQGQQMQGNIAQDMASRGLGGTTVMPALQQQAQRNQALEQENIAAQGNQAKLGVSQNQQGILERVNQTQPNLDLYMKLLGMGGGQAASSTGSKWKSPWEGGNGMGMTAGGSNIHS